MPMLISVHVPKTAGTSFLSVLGSVYGSNWIFEDYKDRVLSADSPVWSDRDRWETVTRKRAIRAVGRSASKVIHGHFLVRKYAEMVPTTPMVIWLRAPVARTISHYFHSGLDKQTGLVAFASNKMMCNPVTRMIEGYSLKDFLFVGISEDFSNEILRLAKKLQWNLSTVMQARLRVNLTKEYAQFSPSSAERKSVADLNAEDIKLYEEALRIRDSEDVSTP